ncbi:MAG: hypothetical protein WC661_16595 [Opitutaceae bacterium]|jgi:hypothetical protein
MRQLRRLILIGLLLSSSLGKAEGMIGAKGLALTFFSSSTSGVLCRLKADEVSPATRKRGPFIMPATGFDVRNPRLELLELKCAAADWESLLKTLAGWERMSSPSGFSVTLPDKRAVVSGTMPRVRAGRLILLLEDGGKRTGLLCIEHDGVAGLRVKLLGRPAQVAAAEPKSEANLVN